MRRWFHKKDHEPDEPEKEGAGPQEEEILELTQAPDEETLTPSEDQEPGQPMDTVPLPAESAAEEASGEMTAEAEAESEPGAAAPRRGFFKRFFDPYESVGEPRHEVEPSAQEVPPEMELSPVFPEEPLEPEAPPAPAEEIPPAMATPPPEIPEAPPAESEEVPPATVPPSPIMVGEALEAEVIPEAAPEHEARPEEPPELRARPQAAPEPLEMPEESPETAREPKAEPEEGIITLEEVLEPEERAALETKKRRFRRFREGLARTRKNLSGGLESLFLGDRKVDA